MTYSRLPETIHPQIAAKLDLASADGPGIPGIHPVRWQLASLPRHRRGAPASGKHYKLVILSNVDRESFAGTNAGPLQAVHFDAVITAQDVGSYKPDLRNFAYMLAKVRSDFGFDTDRVLQTAQSQFHDHRPVKEASVGSMWIVRLGGNGKRGQRGL